MNDVTLTLPADMGGGGFWPGLIVPATILLVALLVTAGIVYFTQVRSPAGESDET